MSTLVSPLLWAVVAILPLAAWLFIGWRGARARAAMPPLTQWVAQLAGAAQRPPLIRCGVVVPARNEAAAIRACVTRLTAQRDVLLDLVIVDDRSTDETATQARESISAYQAAGTPGGHRVTLVQVAALPPGWLGKCNAMHAGAAALSAECKYVLFTDGDIMLEPQAVAAACLRLGQEQADMLAVFPELETTGGWEESMLIAFSVAFFGAFSPEAAADDRRRGAFAGVGAFNLIRKSAYDSIGGHESLRLNVIDDVGLGKMVKRAGLKLRLCTAHGHVRVRWQDGLGGTIRGLEKNGFAGAKYSHLFAAAAIGALLVLYWGPALALASPYIWGRVAGAAGLLAMFAVGGGIAYFSHFRWWAALMLPVGGACLAYALLRSWVLCTVRGGVRWREHTYPLRELRRYTL